MFGVKVFREGYLFLEIYFDKQGYLHKEDAPALQFYIGDKRQEWYCNGRLHCANAPAITDSSGARYWYNQGRFIFSKMPNGSIILNNNFQDKSKAWYLNSVL